MAVDPTEARWFREQQSAARAMLRVYEAVRLELPGGLMDVAQGQTLTTIHRQAMLVQVEAQIAKLQRGMGVLLMDRTSKLAADATDTAAKEIKLAAGGAGASVDANVVIQLSRLNPTLVEHLATRSTILVQSVGDELRAKIRLELASAQAQGLHAREAARRIAGNGLTLDGLKKPVFKSVEHRALTIARTEMATAANDAFSDTLKRAQEMGLPVGKRWSATLDRRTSARCRSLHDRYNDNPIPLDENFEADDGWTGTNAPAHPNCRSRVSTGWLE